MKSVYTGRTQIARRQGSTFTVNLSRRRTWYADEAAADTTATTASTGTQAQATTDAATDAKFTQGDVDKIAGNRAKEAAATARKKLLEELGIENPDDPKALESVKGKLTAAAEAEQAKLTAEQKLTKQIADLEKERDEAKATAESANAKRLADRVDSQIKDLATAAGALHPADVIDYLRTKQTDKVAALLKADESFDDKAAGELIAEVKKARENWFQTARGAGSPSMSGGATPGIDDQKARDEHFKQYRRA